MLFVIVSMFGQGLLHGFGPDHCLAIGALASADGGMRHALRVSLRFGVGHTTVLALGALIATASGLMISARWESVLEIVGGLSLLVLGCLTVLSKRSWLPHAHRGWLPHTHSETTDHSHRDETAPSWADKHFQIALGGLFGLSGIRGLLMTLPLLARHDIVESGVGVALFGLGVVCSMVLVGFFARNASDVIIQRYNTGLRIPVGIASMLCGAFWIVDHVA
jgi:cytochrome c biogenesis protein CcdA